MLVFGLLHGLSRMVRATCLQCRGDERAALVVVVWDGAIHYIPWVFLAWAMIVLDFGL